ncbi:MAG: hypothetical protein GF341_05160 [candidate division Zixibacteria bacterium]|nr:hypothetical protein [candidate division Zixibacteria bacterium]
MTIRLLAIAILAFGLVSCSDSTSPEPVDEGTVQIIDADPQEWQLDHFSLTSMSVQNDSVRIGLMYSGGCKEHQFALFMRPGFIKTNPAQVELYLQHDDQGDPCRTVSTVVTDTLSFHIAPIQTHYANTFGSIDNVLLDLYNFEQTEYVQELYPAE